MTHVTLKSTLIGIALAGTVATLALPSATHASSPYYYGPSQWGKHAISYNDPFSSPGQMRADTGLSFKTHWETTINLSDPSAPIVWTRYKAIFAQRTEKVKVRIGDSGDLPCPLQRVQRHVGGGVRKVYFVHTTVTQPQGSRRVPFRRVNTVAKIIVQVFVEEVASCAHEVDPGIKDYRGNNANFYLFGALGKNSL